MAYIVHTDGGARGNPGPAAIGVVIEKETVSGRGVVPVTSFGKRIGETTNNVAEYTAVIEALKYVIAHRNEFDTSELTLRFYLDSVLVVNQLNGLFKVKQAHLRELLFSVRQAEQEAEANASYTAVPREQNVAADIMVNKALDG